MLEERVRMRDLLALVAAAAAAAIAQHPNTPYHFDLSENK
jgi:hypothetical protein